MKKDVLVVEFQEVFDKVACRIVYQDDEILKRGKFLDEKIGVCSQFAPLFYDEKGYFRIRGIRKDYDDEIMLVHRSDVEIIKEKVKAINEKYGRKERWRAEEGGEYWSILTLFDSCYTPCLQYDYRDSADDGSYEAGNYFKTQEQAEIASKRVLETLKQYQEELLKEE